MSLFNFKSSDSVQDNCEFAHNDFGFPLSTAQLEIWRAQQTNPSNSAYNIGEYIEIHGSIDAILFEQSLRQVVSEAQALRVHIVADGPRQVLDSPPSWSMQVVDVSAEVDARAAAETWMRADLARPIDPTCGPLFAYALFMARPDRFFWYARYHQIVMDSFGMSLLARRLASVYTALANGRPCNDGSLGPLVSLFEEDAAYRESEQFTRDRVFWFDYLAGQPEPITLRNGRATKSNGTLRRSAYLQSSDLERLETIAHRLDTTPARVVVAAMAIYLHRITGAGNLVLGLLVAGRTPVSRDIPGTVAKVLPLRFSISPSMTGSDVIRQANSQIEQVLEHQQYQLSDLSEDLGRTLDGRTMVGPAVHILPLNDDLSFAGSPGRVHNLADGSIDDLSVAIYNRLDRTELRIDFAANSAFYEIDVLADHQRRFLGLLEAAVAEPERAIGRLDILGAAERQTVLRDWNDTARALPFATVPELFAAQAARSPAATAVVSGESEPELWRARGALQPAGALSGPARGRAGGGGRAVPGALAGDGGRAPWHPQGRGGLSAARSGLPGGAPRLHAGGCPGARAAHPVGAARSHRRASRRPDRAAGCRCARHRAGARHRPAQRPQPRQRRLRHLHLGIHRNPQGRLCLTSRHCQPDPKPILRVMVPERGHHSNCAARF